jgi:nitroimidazol reductase NimA-like FMN-containing flavoprotein (pyridoxamine 5'-phosphate oxidase superfamily)
MRIHPLTHQECAGVLERNHLGHLACSRLDQPYVVPIHFSFDAERNCVFGFSTIGQKVEWMRANPKVCLEVSEIVDKYRWATVVVTGRYEEINHAKEEAGTRRWVEDLFRARRQWWFPAAAKLPDQERAEVVVYRIRIMAMTGRRASRQEDQASG